jgi:hypothetical protein
LTAKKCPGAAGLADAARKVQAMTKTSAHLQGIGATRAVLAAAIFAIACWQPAAVKAQGNAPAQPTDAAKGTVKGTVVAQTSSKTLSGVTVRLTGGPTDRPALKKLLDFFATRGVVVDLPTGEPNGAYFQNIIDTAARQGVSLMNPEVQRNIAAFENALASRFVSVTDNAGNFLITAVLPGNYEVVTDSKDHFGPGSNPANPPVHVAVQPGSTNDIRLPMIPGAVVSGRVRNAAGQPLSNMVVQAFVMGYQDGYPLLAPGVQARTDDQGEYKLFWLPPGEYFLATMFPRGRRTPSPDGKDLVTTYYPRNTDTLTAQPIVIRGGEERPGFDIEMQAPSSFKISGRIVSSVTPPAGPGPVGANVGSTTATINILVRDPNVPEVVGPRALGTVQLSQSADNMWSAPFEVSGIQPGIYDLSTWVRESNPDGGSSITIGRTPVEIRDENLTGVELRIYPSVRVLGKVTVDGHAPGAVAARVSLWPDGSAVKVPVYQGIGLRAVVADPKDGAFMVPAVTSGQFRVVTQGLPPEIYVADVLQAGISIHDSGLTVAGKTPDLIEVVLRSGSATIAGTVRDATGKTMAKATVVLVPPTSRRGNRSLYKAVSTDQYGRFTVTGIAPGNYQLFAWQRDPEGAYYNERFLSRYLHRGRPVYVNQESTVPADLTAIPVEAR